jgi:hypothetical protein
VLERQRLVREAATVDGLAARAVAVGEITALHHEVFYDTVEDAALVAEPRLSRGELLKVGRGLGGVVAEQTEHDAAGRLRPDGDVEENLRRDTLISPPGRLCKAAQRARAFLVIVVCGTGGFSSSTARAGRGTAASAAAAAKAAAPARRVSVSGVCGAARGCGAAQQRMPRTLRAGLARAAADATGVVRSVSIA